MTTFSYMKKQYAHMYIFSHFTVTWWVSDIIIRLMNEQIRIKIKLVYNGSKILKLTTEMFGVTIAKTYLCCSLM